MTQTDTPDDGIRAAEYVLRLMPVSEERAFESRLEREPGLMHQVSFWANRLAGLNAAIDPVTPRSAVRKELLARLFGETKKPSFWQRAALWQGLSLASVAVAAFFALQSLQVPLPGQPRPMLVSEIAAEDESLRVLAVVVPATHEIQLTRTAGAAAVGRVFELWGIPPDGSAPISLGVLPDGPTATIPVPEALQAFPTTQITLAISDEPPGGSPTGAPTGAVLALGQITSL